MDLEKLKQLYDNDLSNRQIAKELNCHHKTVSYNLNILGFKSKRFSSSVTRDNSEDKVCTKCKETKSINEYQRGRRGQEHEYEFSYCNSCRSAQTYTALNNNFESYFKDRCRRWKNSAIKSNSLFTINYDYILNIYNLQHGKCFYTEVEMVWGVNTGGNRNIISLDKVVPNLGYIPGNIVLCTNRANTIKCDQTLDEMKQWMPNWHNKIINSKWIIN